jgi:hypothetical protein
LAYHGAPATDGVLPWRGITFLYYVVEIAGSPRMVQNPSLICTTVSPIECLNEPVSALGWPSNLAMESLLVIGGSAQGQVLGCRFGST